MNKLTIKRCWKLSVTYLLLGWLLFLAVPVRVEGALHFWTQQEGRARRFYDEGRIDVTFGEGNIRWNLVLSETNQVVTAKITGPGGDQIIPAGIDLILGMEWFCIREHLGEGLEDDPSTQMGDAKDGAEVVIPIGTALVGPWRFWLVQWDHGSCGLAGSFSTSLVIARHQSTGAWVAKAGYGLGFESLPEGSNAAPVFTFIDARCTRNNCWIHEPWSFVMQGRHAAVVLGKRTYNWDSSELVADTPRQARHWANQEVAWHVASVTHEGGLAEAFGPSPRYKDYFDGIFPVQGTQPFCWRSLVVVAGKDGHRRFLDARQAFNLARSGHWDVVLERRHGQPTATWLVEHDRDFPHSTPPH